MLPKELVMAIRCCYPEPSGIYTGYIHTRNEAQNQQEEASDMEQMRHDADVDNLEDIYI